MEIVHITAGDYPRYEELLLLREQFKKEALQFQRAYIREFGELINRAFEKKIDCIRLKRMVTLCQRERNHRKKPDVKAIAEFVEQQIAVYKLQLEKMIADLNSTKQDKDITEAASQEIKAIYRRIARQLHPDLSDLLKDNPELIDLWERTCIAYKCNDLKMLQETDVLIQRVILQSGGASAAILIPDIQERIEALEAEIQAIVSKEPYSYCIFLENPELKAQKKIDYEQEYQEYCDYEELLMAQLEAITR